MNGFRSFHVCVILVILFLLVGCCVCEKQKIKTIDNTLTLALATGKTVPAKQKKIPTELRVAAISRSPELFPDRH